MEVARLKAILEADTKAAEADLQRAAGKVDQVGQAAGRQGGAAQAMGRAFSAAGATAGYAFAAGVESAATFEQQLRTINTVAQVSDEELAEIGDGIQQIARDTGKSTEDLTAAYYDMVSAGLQPGAEAMEALSLSAYTSLGALGTTADSVDLLTTVLNAYGKDVGESAVVMDTFAKSVEVGKVTMDEIGASIADAAPMAAQMGIDIDELAAAYGFMTARGAPANEVMTQMSGAMRALINPNEELNRIQERTGLNFKQIAEERGLHVALEELRKVTEFNAGALGELANVTEEDFPAALKAAQGELGLLNSEVDSLIAIAGKDGASAAMNELTTVVGAGESAFAGSLGRVEAFRFALSATGDNFDEYSESVVGMGDVTGTVMGQAEESLKGPQVQADRLTQNITTFMQDVAGPFAGTMGPVLLTLNNLGPAFLGPLSPARMLGGAIGWIGTKAIVPMLTGLGNSVIALGRFGASIVTAGARATAFALTALGNAIIGVARFATTLLVQGLTALGRFALSLLTATGRVVLFGTTLAVRAVAGIAAFAGALLVQAGGALVAFAGTIFSTAIPAVVALLAPFLPIIAIIGVVVGVVAGLFLAWQTNFLGIRDIAASVWQAITGFIDTAITNVTNFISGFIEFLGTLWDGVTEGASGVWSAVTGVIGDAVGVITGTISGIADVARGVWDTVSGIFGGIKDAAASVGNAVGGAVDFATGWIPSFQEGTMDTGSGGLALLHPHEAVLPAEVAAALRGWLGSGAGAGASQASVQTAAPSYTVNVYGGNTVTDQGATRELRRMVALS